MLNDGIDSKNDENQSNANNLFDEGLQETLRRSSTLATRRLIGFGCILVITLFAVYAIIANPEFLHSALNYKSIESKEGSTKLVRLSNNLSIRKQRLERIKKIVESQKIELSRLNKSDKKSIVKIMLESRNVRLLTIKHRSTSKTKPISIRLYYRYRLYSTPILRNLSNNTGIYSSNYRNRFRSTKSRYKTLITLTNVPPEIIKQLNIKTYSYRVPIAPSRVVGELVDYFKNNKRQRELFSNRYMKFSKDNLQNNESFVEKTTVQNAQTAKKMKAVIQRFQSDDYIYASVILQKVMITMLIISVGLYFLKAIGTELLFIRKLTIIHLSQSIVNDKLGPNSNDSILVYNALSQGDTADDSPDSVPMKTLDKLTNILSSHAKNAKH